MSRPLGFNRQCEPFGENPQTPSAESGHATGEGVPRRTVVQETRATHVPTGYKRTEAGVIPEGWNVDRIDRHAFIKTGSKNTQDKRDGGEYPFFVRSQAVERIDTYSYDGQAILTAGDGVGTGKVFHYIHGRFDVHQRVYRITDFSERLNGRYFFYQFSERFYDRIMSMTAKSSVDSVRLETIAGMRIPMPPVPEQSAIAAVLSDVDALIGSLEALIAKKRAIKRAAMQQLLTGRTRLPGSTGEWKARTLGDHLRFLRHGSFPRSYLAPNGQGGGGVKYLHYGDIHTSERVCLDPTAMALPTLAKDRASRLDRLSDGDLVFVDASEDIGGVGKSFEITGSEGHELVSGLHTIAVRFNKAVLADGFKAYLQFCPRFRDHLRRLAAGTKVYATNRAHIASAELRVPPLREQRAIATVLTDMDDEITALVRRLDKTRAIKQGIMQQLLTGAVRLPMPDDGPEG